MRLGTTAGRRRGAFTAVAGLMATMVVLVQASPAAAGISAIPVPDFPTTVTVGEQFPARLNLINSSTPPDSAVPLTMSGISLVPSCTSSSPTAECAGAVEAGVFSLGPVGTGGGSCAGISFTITQTPAGVFRFTPSSPVVLTAGQTCLVDFVVTALRAPTNDVLPGQPGPQTTQVATATATAPDGRFTRNVGNDSVTVLRASPTLVTQATPGSAQIGQQLRDNATLSSAVNPTGTITFALYSDPTCTVQIFSNTVPVAGNGTYNSAPFTPVTAGTYRWVATYSGDVNNNPAGPTACQDPAETVVVSRANPQITTVATPASSTVGTPLRDTATLAGGFNPTGTVTFRLYSDPACTIQVFTSTNPLNASGVATSGTFAPASPGTYRWRATYSGDVNNNAIGLTPCGEPLETVTVTAAPPSRPPADFDGDTRTDVAIFRPSNGAWFVRGSAGADMGIVYGGVAGDLAVPADYDGDGRVDIAIYRPSNGGWFIRGSAGTDFGLLFGSPGDIPVPADYDGDRRADVTVFRPSTGTWFIHGSTGVDRTVAYGVAGDVPVAADYDGDGRADVAVYRPANGAWFIRGSAGTDVGLVYGGLAGDIPVPGDYDGDNRADIAIYRPSNGGWFIRGSAGTDAGVLFGSPGDRPVPGDYDGDRRTDIAVYRPSTGTWFIRAASSGAVSSVVYGGVAGDVPLPLPPAVHRAYFSGA